MSAFRGHPLYGPTITINGEEWEYIPETNEWVYYEDLFRGWREHFMTDAEMTARLEADGE